MMGSLEHPPCIALLQQRLACSPSRDRPRWHSLVDPRRSGCSSRTCRACSTVLWWPCATTIRLQPVNCAARPGHPEQQCRGVCCGLSIQQLERPADLVAGKREQVHGPRPLGSWAFRGSGASIAGLAIFVDVGTVVGPGLDQLSGRTCCHLTDQDRRAQHQQDPGCRSNHVHRHLLGELWVWDAVLALAWAMVFAAIPEVISTGRLLRDRCS